MKKLPTKNRITFDMREWLSKRIRKHADEEEISIADVLRKILTDYYKK